MASNLKVFISYRRIDDHGGVGRLFDRLEDHYGKGNVFMDVDSDMPLGVDFREFITNQVLSADLVLAIIGPNWLRTIQEKVEDPLDFVRVEIEAALAKAVAVVPVLLGGEVAVPTEAQLPDSIGKLAYLHGTVVDPRGDFRLHVERLIRSLDRSLQIRVAPPQAEISTLPQLGEVKTNSLGMEMIWCPPGTFLMGSPESEEGWRSTEIQHEVTLTKGFWIARHPVTQGQWETVMGSNPSHFKLSGKDAPVEQVNWQEAMDFCARLTGSDSADGSYTLPTEAQWEYACRAGTTGPYAGSSLDILGWHRSNSGSKTHSVGQKEPNPWGIHDMHGNVYEWCLDWYEEDLGTEPATNPTGSKEAPDRVIRGGSWLNIAWRCRSADRIRYNPGNRDDYVGFRPVLVPAS